MTTQTIKIQPAVLDIGLYGDGYAWAVELHVPGLGDLTGADITAAFKPTSDEATTLTVTRTAENDLDSRFSIGYDDTIAGRYDITIALDGGVERTYIAGTIRVEPDYAP